jgi:hypothetical protein
VSWKISPKTQVRLEFEAQDDNRNNGSPLIWVRDPVTNQYIRKLTEQFYFSTTGPGGPGGLGHGSNGNSIDQRAPYVYNAVIEHRFNDIFSLRISGQHWRRDLTQTMQSSATPVDPVDVTRRFTYSPAYLILDRKGDQFFADLLAAYNLGNTTQKTLLTYDHRIQVDHNSTQALPTTDPNNAYVVNIDNPQWYYPTFSNAVYSRTTAQRFGALTLKRNVHLTEWDAASARGRYANTTPG